MSANTSILSIPHTHGPEPQDIPKRIPRPPNSFMIYRREKATQHVGIIAAELSTKLAKAWRNETPETRAHYVRLAEQAKAEHTLRYPTYKFTPARRGTGKRAKAIAATFRPDPRLSRHTRPKSHLESSALSIPSMAPSSSVEKATVPSQGLAYSPVNHVNHASHANPNVFTTTKNNEGSSLTTSYSFATSLASPSLFFSSTQLPRSQQRGPVKPVVRGSISTARAVPYTYTPPSLSFSYAPAQQPSILSPSLAPSQPQAPQVQQSLTPGPLPFTMMNHMSHHGLTRALSLNTDPQCLSNLDLLNIVLPMSQDEQYVTQWISQASTSLPTSLPLEVGFYDPSTMMPTLDHFLPETSWKTPSVSSSAIPYSLSVGEIPTMVPSLVYSPLVRDQNYSTSSVSSLESEMGPFELPLASYAVSPVSTTCGGNGTMGMCAMSVSATMMSSPFMLPLLVSQDMVISPVLSTCSSYSPSLSNPHYDSDTLFKC